MSFGPLKRLPSGAPADSTVRVPSFSRRMTVRSLSAHQISRPCESKLAQLGPIKQHVRAAAARLRAGVADVRAAVAGLLHEHRHVLSAEIL